MSGILKKRFKSYFGLVWLFLASHVSFAAGTKIRLQCEHLGNPIGIDNPHPRLSWQLACEGRGMIQAGYYLAVGIDSLNLQHGGKTTMVWMLSKRSGQQLVVYRGNPLAPFTKYYWQVTVTGQKGAQTRSVIASFETGPMNLSDWQGDWITDKKDINIKPAPCFRKSFTVQKSIISARAYIAAAGLYELSVNGTKTGDHILDPAYTRFDRQNLYVTYDVTKQLQQGQNVIGVLLGNGWYNMQSPAVWFFDKAPWRGRPCFCMDLRITYSDGTTETISTDKSWQTTLSNITFNSIYTGEHIDARFSDTVWKQVVVTHAPSGHIVAREMYPIRDIEKLSAISLRKFNDTDYLFNIGRNIAGVSEIRVKGAAGTTIKLKHAERLDSTGHADQSNVNYHYRPVGDSDPFQTDVYTLDGKTDTFRPHFNYKGFQYVEVTFSAPMTLDKSSLVAYFEHSDVPVVGSIISSDTLINKIWEATNNSYVSNLFGYPTDCPQREKNGWTGDAHTAIETGLYNFDGITVYEKWLADIRDAQQPNGTIPAIVPTSDWGYDHHNGPDWVSGIAIIPWELYVFYDDSKALADNYEAIKSYVNLLNRRYPAGLCNWGLGDWIPIESRTPVEFTSTVFYYQDALMLAKAAKLFGKKSDQRFYSDLAEKIKTAFNQKYLEKATGNYDQGFQTELSFALFYHLVPESLQAKTAVLLAKAVETGGVHLDVGLLGSKTILNALSENGYAELAYQLATLTKYPSWGYWIKNGMTTLPEEWDIGPKSDGSLNHIMFGEISAWFYKGLGGIIPDEHDPGFHHILLRPNIVAGLDSFRAEHDSPYGKIVSSWKTENGVICYKAVIPPNAIADLQLTIHGKIVKVCRLGSGSYTGKFTFAAQKQVQDKLVVLTFDDACISHYTYVAPLLRKYHFGATFYVCEFPGWPDSTKYMTWAQIQQLSIWGFEIGNHTWHHQNLNEANEERTRKEIAYIEHKSDSLHIPKPTSFAYPAYHTSDTALKVLKEMGYQTARIGGDRAYNPASDNPLLIPSFMLLKDNRRLFYDALSQAKGGKVVVFTIHGVPDAAHPWVTLPPELFESYLKYLHEGHYRVVAMRELQKYFPKKK